MWRLSQFVYANYSAPPYFTYWRRTIFFDEDHGAPTTRDITEGAVELMYFAAEESNKKGWEVSPTIRDEIEQLDEEERYAMPFNESRISISHGRIPGIPSEDYVRPRQSRLP